MGFMDISISGSDTASDFDWVIGKCRSKKKRKEMIMEEQQETVIGGTKLEKKKKVKRTKPVYYGDDE